MNYFYLVLTILLALPVAQNAEKVSIDNLNSVFLSQLRLSVRLLEEPVEQCVRYLQGIKDKLEPSDAKETARRNEPLNLNILHQVGQMLRTRTPSLNSNSLIAYTDNCLDVLSKYQGHDYVFINQSSQVQPAANNNEQGTSLEIERSFKLEKENAELRGELEAVKSKLEQQSQELARLADREQAHQRELADLSREHAEKMAAASSETETLRQKQNDCRRELELARSSQNADSLQMHKDIEAAKVQAQEERNRCVDQLNRANEAKTHCELDLGKLKTTGNNERLEFGKILQDCTNKHKQALSEGDVLKRKLEELSNELNRSKSSGKSDSCDRDRESLKKCKKELEKAKSSADDRNVDGQVACWTEREELKEAALKLHAAIGRARSERDECYDISAGLKSKAKAYDRLTVKAHKLLKKGYDVYCSKWKVRDHERDDDDSDDDSDDDD